MDPRRADEANAGSHLSGTNPLIRAAIWAALAWCLGIVAAGTWRWPALPCLAAAAVAITIAVTGIHRHPKRWAAGTWMAIAALGAARFAIADVFPPSHIGRLMPGTALTLQGVVAEKDASRYLIRVTGRVTEREMSDGRWIPAIGTVRVWQRDARPIELGHSVHWQGVIEPWKPTLESPARPSLLESSRRRRAVPMRLTAPLAELSATRLSAGPNPRQQIRDTIIDRCHRHLALAPAELITSLVLGHQAAPAETAEVFRSTGTLHLIAVSGQHLSLLACAAAMAARPLPLAAGGALVVALVVAYGWIVGAFAAVWRAVVMAVWALGADSLDRPVRAGYLLPVAVIALTAFEPGWLFEPGFQLSVAAVAALIASSRRVGERILRVLSASLAVWLVTSPLLLWHFGRLYPWSIAANLWAAPWVMGLLLAAWAGLATGGGLWTCGFADGLSAACIILESGLRWMSGWPASEWLLGRPAAWAVWPAVALSLGAIGLWRTGKKALGTAALLIGWACMLLTIGPPSVAVGGAIIQIVDVGQGDLIWIRTARHQWLIDTGPAGSRPAAEKTLIPFLEKAGSTVLSGVFLTHEDLDHRGGWETVRHRLRVRRLFQNITEGGSLCAGAVFHLEPAIRLEVLSPPSSMDPAWPRNDRSLVMRLVVGRTRFMFTGDIGARGIRQLIRSGWDLRADVLQIPHHGADPGEVVGELLDQVRPRYAWISVGERNRYGHPKQTTLKRLRDAGTPVFRTDQMGPIQFHTDGYQVQAPELSSDNYIK